MTWRKPPPERPRISSRCFDYAGLRLLNRLHGLTDAEWRWCPTADRRISLRWRLEHIAQVLREHRNWAWLGLTAPPEGSGAESGASASSADAAVEATAAAISGLRAALSTPGLDLDAPIGAAAGSYGDATRRSFVLHILDELIHHAAEAALLRDLFAQRYPGVVEPGGS